MRGDPSAEALSYKQVSRSASEPLPLSLVIVKIPCGQRVILREAEKKRRSRFAARKAWRGIEGRRVWKVASGTWETCGAKASAGVGRAHSSGEAGQCPWMRRASACKRGYIGFNGGGSDTSRVPHGEPYAGKLHVRFDEGAGVPDNKGRPALLYSLRSL